MSDVQVTFLGSGDAFGSGGRLQACILVRTPATSFLLDCGCTATIATRRFRVNSSSIDAILLSHLHGDHFGGLPFFILDAQLVSKRASSLVLAGPPGTEERVKGAMEALFPGSSTAARKFEVRTVELPAGQPTEVGDIRVTPFTMQHSAGTQPLGLRVEAAGRIIAYSGDTEWTEELVPLARDADLFICECYSFDRPIKLHLDYRTLSRHAGELGARRIILTHMGQDMLDHLDEIPWETAYDGLAIKV